ncbi:hypothetical protein D3C84_845970 [compost metagenome]
MIWLHQLFQNAREQRSTHRVNQQTVVSPCIFGQHLQYINEALFGIVLRQTQSFDSLNVFVVGDHVDATLQPGQVTQVDFSIFLQFNTELVDTRFQSGGEILTHLQYSDVTTDHVLRGNHVFEII